MRIFIGYFLLSLFVFANAEARVVFLPDYGSDRVSFKRFEDGNTNNDEPMCAQGGYHEAAGCPEPKIFDDFCPFDDDWISDCYCPSIFSEKCDGANEKGDIRQTDDDGYASCDGLWVGCCETSCPEGTAVDNPVACGVGGKNGCGETCYKPYYVIPDDENCEYGVWVDGCDAGCGEKRDCCKSCEDNGGSRDCTGDRTTPCGDGEEEVSTCTNCYGKTIYTCETICTPIANDTECPYGFKEGGCDDGCGGTRKCCAGCTPKLTAVVASACSYGTKQVDNGCGVKVEQCKTCADNGGTEDCTGQTTACGTNQSEKSSCTDCNGTKRYTCEDIVVDEKCTDDRCIVGNIYYSDGTCNECLLEGKTPVGVVVKDYEVVMSLKRSSSISWGEEDDNVYNLDEMSTPVFEEAKLDFNGFDNTAAIVADYGASSNWAASYCYNFVPEGMESTKNKWYLPAMGELNSYLYGNYEKLKDAYTTKLGYSKGYLVQSFWSSSESSNTKAWYLFFNTSGAVSRSDLAKSQHATLATCFLRIKDSTQENIDKQFYDGSETCKGSTQCVVGAIYYKDGTCCSDYLPSKGYAGIVVKDNALIMSPLKSMRWGDTVPNISPVPDIGYNNTTKLKNDMNGKTYTSDIVTHIGRKTSPTRYAALYCRSYYPKYMEDTKKEWYLPSMGELFIVQQNYNKIKETASKIGWFNIDNVVVWSSNEFDAENAWGMNFLTSNLSEGVGCKTRYLYVGCFLKI